jgi:hypothetical protein
MRSQRIDAANSAFFYVPDQCGSDDRSIIDYFVPEHIQIYLGKNQNRSEIKLYTFTVGMFFLIQGKKSVGIKMIYCVITEVIISFPFNEPCESITSNTQF